MLTARNDGAIPLDGQFGGTSNLTVYEGCTVGAAVRGQAAVYPLQFDVELKCDPGSQYFFFNHTETTAIAKGLPEGINCVSMIQKCIQSPDYGPSDLY